MFNLVRNIYHDQNHKQQHTSTVILDTFWNWWNVKYFALPFWSFGELYNYKVLHLFLHSPSLPVWTARCDLQFFFLNWIYFDNICSLFTSKKNRCAKKILIVILYFLYYSNMFMKNFVAIHCETHLIFLLVSVCFDPCPKYN